MITIETATKEGYTDTLKMKGLMPGKEYAIIALGGRYDEPLTGESQYGTWYLFDLDVYEYKTFDMDKEGFITEKFDTPKEAGYFCGENSGMYRKLSTLQPGDKIKVTMEEMDNGKTRYVMEDLNSVKNISSESSEADEIAEFIKGKVSVLDTQDIVSLVATKYGKSSEEIKSTYGGLLK